MNLSRPSTPSRSIAVLTISAFLFLLAACIYSGYRSAQHAGWINPRIACDEPIIQLGQVEPDSVHHFEFQIRNVGRQTLKIHRLRVGCGRCLRVLTPDQFSVGPQSSSQLSVEFHPGKTTGPTMRSVVVYSNDPVQPLLTLRVKTDGVFDDEERTSGS